MQQINISELTTHPKNDYFFDDITGENWDAFLESIKTSGVIEPVIVTQDKTIVSGHQRIRACKSLGIQTVQCDIRIYDNDDHLLKDLIETNLRQRGIGNTNPIKLGRCIKELERIYGIKNGNNQYNSLPNYSEPIMNQNNLASVIGISVDTLRNYKKLTDLIPELTDLVDTGIVTPTTALSIVKSMTPEEQEQFISSMDVTKRITQKQAQQYIEEMQQLKIKVKNTDNLEKQIQDNQIEQQRLKNKISELIQNGTKTEVITKQVDNPETLAELSKLKKQLEENNKRNTELSYSIIEKEKMLNQAMGISTNYQLTSRCSEITKKMLDFVRDMAQYDYMAESFNEIPNATRIEYEKCIKSVKKWADRILSVVELKENITENERMN